MLIACCERHQVLIRGNTLTNLRGNALTPVHETTLTIPENRNTEFRKSEKWLLGATKSVAVAPTRRDAVVVADRGPEEELIMVERAPAQSTMAVTRRPQRIRPLPHVPSHIVHAIRAHAIRFLTHRPR